MHLLRLEIVQKSYNLSTRIVLALILVIAYLNIGAAQDCKEQANNLFDLQKKFSKLKIEKIKSDLDSLIQIASDDCQRAQMIAVLLKGRIQYTEGNYTSASTLFNRSLTFAKDLDDKLYQKQIFDFLASIEQYNGFPNEALKLRNSAKDIPCELLSCQKQNIKLILNNAVVLVQANRFQEAINTYVRANALLSEYQFENDSIYRVSIFNAIGNIYNTELGDNQASLESYLNALKFCPKGHRAKYLLMNNIGNRLNTLNQLDSSEYYYNKTINEINIDRYLIVPWQGKGDLAIKRKQYKQGIDCYKKAIIHAEKANRDNYIYHSKVLLAKAYFLQGNYREAKSLFDSSRAYFKTENTYESEIIEIDKYIYFNQLALQKPKLGMELYDFYRKYDSIHSVERTNRLDRSIARFEKRITQDSLNQVELLAENQNLTIKNQRQGIWIILLFLACSIFLIYHISRLLKSSKNSNKLLVYKNEEIVHINKLLKKRLKEAEQKSLEENTQKLRIKSLGKIYQISDETIRYIKAEDDGVRIFLEDSSIWSDTSLKNFFAQLNQENFIQIYRSTIINLDFVEWVNNSSLRLNNGVELKIGRTYKEKLLSAVEPKD